MAPTTRRWAQGRLPPTAKTRFPGILGAGWSIPTIPARPARGSPQQTTPTAGAIPPAGPPAHRECHRPAMPAFPAPPPPTAWWHSPGFHPCLPAHTVWAGTRRTPPRSGWRRHRLCAATRATAHHHARLRPGLQAGRSTRLCHPSHAFRAFHQTTSATSHSIDLPCAFYSFIVCHSGPSPSTSRHPATVQPANQIAQRGQSVVVAVERVLFGVATIRVVAVAARL